MRGKGRGGCGGGEDEEAGKVKADGEKKVEVWQTDDAEMRGVSPFNLKVVGQKYSWWNIIEIELS